MAGRRKLLDEHNWNEVWFINKYAIFMGYLSMAIKGLGFLVLTWTTVVLLGGFVSNLETKDFWCLTFITLVQTAGIFDGYMNEKLRHIRKSISGLAVTVLSAMIDKQSPGHACSLLAYVLTLVQMLVLCSLLIPLAILYLIGILISGGISLWRLIEHNTQGKSDGKESNMTPALNTLYSLGLIQGSIFLYRNLLHCSQKRLAKRVATDNSEYEVVYNYLRKTRRRCEKNPVFAEGRNLIIDAVDMISSNSPVDSAYGVKILYTAIRMVERELREEESNKGSKDYCDQRDIVRGKCMLMKHLVVSASSTHILQKLLETLDSKGLHDREMRNQAAKIVERLACNINLEQFPRGIQHISSLIGTFEQYSIAKPYQRECLFDEYERDWKSRARCLAPSLADDDDARGKLGTDYKELLLQGLCILRRLATDENNCRVMSDTQGLVSKIMAPVTSDLLHHTTDDHGAWSNIVQGSMYVMRQLIDARGKTGAKLRHEISSCTGAISTLWRILNCSECNEELQLSAIWILTHLYMDNESSRAAVHKQESSSGGGSREDFVRKLVDIFTHDNKFNKIRAYAGRALSGICLRGGISGVDIQISGGDVVDSLTKVLVHDENEICRQAAAEILEHLCTHYTKDDKYLGKLKKAMTGAIPKVIEQIISCGDKTHTGNDEQDEEEKVFQAVLQSVRSADLLSSLVSLCGTIYGMFISELGRDLAPRFDAPSFLDKLKEMVEKRNPTVENLSVLKVIAKMVKSMMKHSNTIVKQEGYKSLREAFKQENLDSLREAFSGASNYMLDLDHSMVFRYPTNNSETTTELDGCTLASLVRELHIMVWTQPDSVNVPKGSTGIGPEAMMFEGAKNSLSCTQPKETMGGTQMDSVNVPKKSINIGPKAMMLEGVENYVLSTQPKEVHTGKAMSRHNKPKKAVTKVTPQDYVCNPEYIMPTPKITKFVEIDDATTTTTTKAFSPKRVEIDDAFLKQDELERLRNDGVFLHDNVINAYIYCIRDQDHLRERADGKVHLTSAYVSALLKRDGDIEIDEAEHNDIVKSVDNYLEHDMVFLPINDPDFHWYLAVVNAKKGEIQVLDSTGVRTNWTDLTATLKGLKKHLDIASERDGFKKGEKWRERDLDVTRWPVVEQFELRAQNDGSSCGLFMLKYMEYWTGDMMSNHVTQEDMKEFRRKLPDLLFNSELNKIKGSLIYKHTDNEENVSDSNVLIFPSLKQPDSPDRTDDKSSLYTLPSRIMPTNPHELVVELCKYIMIMPASPHELVVELCKYIVSIHNAKCLEKEWVWSSNTYPIGLSVKKIQDISRPS